MKLGVAWMVFVITGVGTSSPVSRHHRASRGAEKWWGVVMEGDAHRSEEETSPTLPN